FFQLSINGCSSLNSRYSSGLIIGIPFTIGKYLSHFLQASNPSKTFCSKSCANICNDKSALSNGQHSLFIVVNFMTFFYLIILDIFLLFEQDLENPLFRK